MGGHPGNGAARAAGGQSVQCYEELVPEELGRESELGVDPRPDPAAAMGKRQHQKDKMYITCAEYTHFYGGKKPDLPQANFRRLPFDHCSLSLQPFEYPVCTPDGVVFDLLNIVPWIKKYGTNPSTGEKLDAKSLIKLNFTKNNEGKYHCPVLFTVFTNNSHIVAIRSTGNVYAYEAVEQLNIKTKNYKDLLTDEAFSRQDIVTLQSGTRASAQLGLRAAL